MSAEIVRLKNDFDIESEKFLDLVHAGEITHGVMVYRLKSGQLGYTFLGGEHKTYLIGLMMRIIHRLQSVADEEGVFIDDYSVEDD